jgi:DNA polymerase-3 subunit gamma/tau
LRLLEATPAIRQRYLNQTKNCSEDFLYRALDAGSNADVSIRTSKNPRLHIELLLIRLCRLNNESALLTNEKKKPDLKVDDTTDEIFPLPSKSVIIRESEAAAVKKQKTEISEPARNFTHTVKPSKSFSIKEFISEEDKQSGKEENIEKNTPENQPPATANLKITEFTPDTFEKAWSDFTHQLKGEGTRIISMFRSVKTELDNDHIIRLHLNNAAQKDLFIQNYKQRLLSFLTTRFDIRDIDIETVVDVSESNEILYSDEQKYNFLVSKYPQLREMKKAFNLDLT